MQRVLEVQSKRGEEGFYEQRESRPWLGNIQIQLNQASGNSSTSDQQMWLKLMNGIGLGLLNRQDSCVAWSARAASDEFLTVANIMLRRCWVRWLISLKWRFGLTGHILMVFIGGGLTSLIWKYYFNRYVKTNIVFF